MSKTAHRLPTDGIERRIPIGEKHIWSVYIVRIQIAIQKSDTAARNRIERIPSVRLILFYESLFREYGKPTARVTTIKWYIPCEIAGCELQFVVSPQKTEDGFVGRLHPFHPPVHFPQNAKASDLSDPVISFIQQLHCFQTTKSLPRTKYLQLNLQVNGTTRGPATHRLGPFEINADPESGPRVRVGSRENGTEPMQQKDERGLEGSARHGESNADRLICSDGGKITVCPDCESSKIEVVSAPSVQRDGVTESGYRCGDCKSTFTDPDTRYPEREMDRPGLAGDLADLDPSTPLEDLSEALDLSGTRPRKTSGAVTQEDS